MAITPLTGFKAFTFDGETSTDYGVQILGEGVFNAPEREVEMINIPGRNGAFALDKGRFENIDVKYPANIIADSTEDFAEAVSDLRNFLCSRKGYCRLTDDYHPDEYRMAVYREGLEVDERVLRAGDFDIVFDCMPQRYLTSGEEAITVADGETITNPTRFDAKPMLEVEGYGTIAFNGYEIELDNAVMGDIVLAEPYVDTFKHYFLIYFNNAQFNNGDAITLNGALYKWHQTTAGSTLSSVTSITHSNNKFSTSYTGTASVLSPATTTVQSIAFTAGTDSTVTDTMTLTGVRDGATVTLVVETNISYTYDRSYGRSLIELSTWKTSETSDRLYYDVTFMSHSGAIGESSVSILGDPTYIDCDLGEAYMIKDNVPISLDAYIDLGSDLPKLAPGNNVISYDDTVTELNVVPRWWKV